MRSVDAFSRLDEHQALIRQQLAAAIDRVRDGQVRRETEAAQTRWQMLRLLRNYQLFKHVEIYEPFTRSRDAGRAAAARGLKAACIHASENYRTFTLLWNADRIAGDWGGYCGAVLNMVSLIEQHLITERAAIVRLMADIHRTRRN